MQEELKNIANKFKRQKTLENGKVIEIKVLKTMVGIAVARRLLKVVAPAIGGAADGMRHDDFIHGAPKSFTNLALTLCDQIDSVKLEELITILLDEMTIDGKDVDLDEYFSANYGELIEILEFALRENFESFFMGKGIKARFLKTIEAVLVGSTPQES